MLRFARSNVLKQASCIVISPYSTDVKHDSRRRHLRLSKKVGSHFRFTKGKKVGPTKIIVHEPEIIVSEVHKRHIMGQKRYNEIYDIREPEIIASEVHKRHIIGIERYNELHDIRNKDLQWSPACYTPSKRRIIGIKRYVSVLATGVFVVFVALSGSVVCATVLFCDDIPLFPTILIISTVFGVVAAMGTIF